MKNSKNTSLSFLLLISTRYIYILFLFLLFFSSCDEPEAPPPDPVFGCIDENACNYNSLATETDNTCWDANEGCTCDDAQGSEADCAGICNGLTIYDCHYNPDDTSTWEDSCGGNALEDCAGVCGGSLVEDCTGVCGGGCDCEDIPEGHCDCNGGEPDCNDNCCNTDLYNECMVILNDSTDSDSDGIWDNLQDFCDDNFVPGDLLYFSCTALNLISVDGFCEYQFGCAEIDCRGICSGGNTQIDSYSYDICGCFDEDAINYWCNDGGECSPGDSDDDAGDLPCQDECIYSAWSESHIAVNPSEFDNGFSAYNDIETCEYINYLKIGTITDTTIEILIHTSEEIGGFQFAVSGVELSAGEGVGGLAETNGFSVTTGPNGVLGFSLTGNVIPPTEDETALTTINYSNPDGESICIPDIENHPIYWSLLISDSIGTNITLEINFIIHYNSSCEN